ncbi:GntR family transcriptional regulator [Oerskovia jenensis]|uniref:DNA-binding GntR family transcriptional regulator n=1 Tax=Oerskovia jenensis TaxID=162169 RepID=A0ABS2LKM8_9CELL|nr:GntR family transcriptional regulator [Oerskovia jenensis]MBM7480971.1 DNA-binding GntR family transcriptional regulator [Oerskovia jenensis]
MPIPQGEVLAIGRGNTPLHATVFDELKDDIVSGTLRPGDPLVEADLIARFGTSRTPIREALNRLSALGLVEIAPRKHTLVSRLDPWRAKDAVETLDALWRHANKHVTPHAAEEDVEVARRVLRERTTTVDVRREIVAGRYMLLADVTLDRYANSAFCRLRDELRPMLARYLASRVDAIDLDDALARTRKHAQAMVDRDPVAAREALTGFVDSVLPQAMPPRQARPTDERSGTRRLMSDQIADRMREAIMDGTLEPGEQLTESELIAWMGTSRTPIRVALNVLADEGFVDIEPNRQPRVSRPSDQEYADISVAVGVLTQEVVRRAAPHLTEQDLTALDDAATAMGEAVESRAFGAVAQSAAAYSDLLRSRCENQVLVEVGAKLSASMQRVVVANRPTTLKRLGPDPYHRVVELLRAGDVESAVRTIGRVYDIDAVDPAPGPEDSSRR